MKKIKIKIKDKKMEILKGVGIGGIGLLILYNLDVNKRLNRLSKSFKRLTNIIAEVEEERQGHEFKSDLRMELLEDMVKDIYINDIEVYDDFEKIDGEEI